MPGRVTEYAVAAGYPEDRVPQLLQAVAKGTAAAFQSLPDVTPTVMDAIQAAQKRVYSMSLSTVYLSSLGWGGLALITCFFATKDMENNFTNFVNKIVSSGNQPGHTKEDVEKSVTDPEA